MEISKRAVILAGGEGVRLRPYTTVFPKPMMPVGDYPILEIIIRQLVYCGFTHITLAVKYKAGLIKAFFGNGDKWNVRIDYSFEKSPLGTIGPLKLIHDLPSNFLVMNGDILTDLDFYEFYQNHIDSDSNFTIACSQRSVCSEFGVLEVDDCNKLYAFKEKPTVQYDVSMGVYMASFEILDYISKDEAYGFDDLMNDLIDSPKKPNVVKFDGYWLDIGRNGDYVCAMDEFDSLKNLFLK